MLYVAGGRKTGRGGVLGGGGSSVSKRCPSPS